jgi:hypothetical protein
MVEHYVIVFLAGIIVGGLIFLTVTGSRGGYYHG